MADSGAIRAGRAFVELFADDSKLAKGLKAAEAKLKAFGDGITKVGAGLAGLGAAITAPLAAAVALYTETGSALGKMSARTGIAVEELSALQYAAKRSGVEAEGLEHGLRHMQKALFEAGDGSAEAQQALGRLGITLEDMGKISPDRQLERLADAFAGLTDPTEKTGLALKIFGKTGTELIPFLNKGAAGIEVLKDEARRLGVVLTGQDVQAAKEFKAVMAQLKGMLMGVSLAIGSAVLPGMTRLRNLLMPAVETVTKFARENKALFDVLFDVGTGLAAAGAALVIVGQGVKLLGSSLAALVPIGKLLTGVVAGAFKLWAAAFYAALSPMGLLLIAVGGITAAFIMLTETGAQIRASIVGAFEGVAVVVKSTWGGIVDAIKAGDLSLAFKIAVAGAKVVWFGFLATLRKAWLDIVLNFKSMFMDAFANILIGSVALNKALGLMTEKEANAQIGVVIEGNKQFQAGIEQSRVKGKAEIDETSGLADAIKDLNGLLGEAARKRRNVDLLKNANRMGMAFPENEAVRGLGESQGTFSAGGALRMAGGQTIFQAQRVLLEDIRDKLEEILKQQQANGGMRFA